MTPSPQSMSAYRARPRCLRLRDATFARLQLLRRYRATLGLSDALDRELLALAGRLRDRGIDPDTIRPGPRPARPKRGLGPLLDHRRMGGDLSDGW